VGETGVHIVGSVDKYSFIVLLLSLTTKTVMDEDFNFWNDNVKMMRLVEIRLVCRNFSEFCYSTDHFSNEEYNEC
jgi:hypothetical protein